MKKTIKLMVSAVLAATMLVGCGSTGTTDSGNEGTSEAASSSDDVITMSGSTSMEKLCNTLKEEYMNKTGVEIDVQFTGSGAGIQAVMSGSCDIGLSSRDLKEDEAKTLDAKVVAIDGIAMVVNPENTVSDLTIDQIAKLYKGEITNWSEVGGADAPVVLIGREAASGTRDGFESITDTKDACAYAQELTSTGDVIQTVASNPNAIGYASLAAVKDTVRALKVEGVSPTTETIQDGSYKIQRDFNIVTKKGKELTGAAKAFYDFATSKEADSLIEKAGAVPVVR